MTPELDSRWRAAAAPFDGKVLVLDEADGLVRLRSVLIQAYYELRPAFPLIYQYDDWHEHDGLVVSAKRASWDRVFAATATVRSLFDSRHDDFAVRRAIYPASFEWLLRYN